VGPGPVSGAFFPGKPYIGRGMRAERPRRWLLRFRADVIALQPKVVVILAGTKRPCAGNTGPIALAGTEGNLASMAELARANGIRAVLSSVFAGEHYGQDRDGNSLDLLRSSVPARNKILE